ncbi:hypothetical protein HRbin09_00082 [bacterium HR09]|nr:hypothetical protein HRbin09_00082 [bacterium HR09]
MQLAVGVDQAGKLFRFPAQDHRRFGDDERRGAGAAVQKRHLAHQIAGGKRRLHLRTHRAAAHHLDRSRKDEKHVVILLPFVGQGLSRPKLLLACHLHQLQELGIGKVAENLKAAHIQGQAQEVFLGHSRAGGFASQPHQGVGGEQPGPGQRHVVAGPLQQLRPLAVELGQLLPGEPAQVSQGFHAPASRGFFRIAYTLGKQQGVHRVAEGLQVILKLQGNAGAFHRQLTVQGVEAPGLDELLQGGAQVPAAKVEVTGTGVGQVVKGRPQLGQVKHLLGAPQLPTPFQDAGHAHGMGSLQVAALVLPLRVLCRLGQLLEHQHALAQGLGAGGKGGGNFQNLGGKGVLPCSRKPLRQCRKLFGKDGVLFHRVPAHKLGTNASLGSPFRAVKRAWRLRAARWR